MVEKLLYLLIFISVVERWLYVSIKSFLETKLPFLKSENSIFWGNRVRVVKYGDLSDVYNMPTPYSKL